MTKLRVFEPRPLVIAALHLPPFGRERSMAWLEDYVAVNARVFAEAGGLIAYSADREEMFGRAAGYADRIFRGENPGELPVQQPTRYELVVNLRAARAIGLTIPDIVMLRADEVID